VIGLTVVEQVVEWIQPVFVVAGYYIVAAAVLAERSIFIGLVVPGDFILALGGVYAARGKLSLALIVLVGTVAAIIGESIGYWVGRKYGMGVIKHIPLVRRLEEPLVRAQVYFARHGGRTVAIGRFATAVGALVPFTAGVARMPYQRFLLFDVPAIIVWATGISVFGYLFGENLTFVDKVLSRFGYVVLGLVVVIFGVRFLWRRWSQPKGEAGSPG
jgi:membrane-associated protein